MVNRPLPGTVATCLTRAPRRIQPHYCAAFYMANPSQQTGSRAFAQILGKLYFFELLENLRRILLDYAQKRTGRANAAFNGPC
jgi:hypothetical protein